MYKAVHARSGEEILSLGPNSQERKEQLRAFDRQDLLLCQGCRQSVRLKSGARKRPHFAHKHLQGCSYGSESARMLEARGLLYETLVAHFPGQVDVEWKPVDVELPRPVDCVVHAAQGTFAFWLIDATLKLEARVQIHAAFERLELAVTAVLLSNMLHPDPEHPAWLLLSPTERDFLCQTPFDEIGREQRLFAQDFGSTLHYLDLDSQRLITYRSLERVHAPNVFCGRREECLLSDLAFSAQGLFLYPGEERALTASRGQRLRQAERARRWLEPVVSQAARSIVPAHSPIDRPAPHSERVTCIFCGELTANWWTSWSEDGERLGKCRDCLDRGLG